jgi:hypothetical protein
MQIDSSIVSALSAVFGSIVGASSTIATTWFTQKTQSKREHIETEVRKREQLYADFIAECSKLAVDSVDHSLDNPEKLIAVYALQNRIRLISSDAVDRAADQAIAHIVAQYFKPNLTKDEMRSIALSHGYDPLRPFSDACREEIRAMQRGI